MQLHHLNLKTSIKGLIFFPVKSEGHVYGRYGNPTIEVVAEKIARLETFNLNMEAHCILTSSGMSAISTLAMAALKKDDKILTQGNLYGGSTEFIHKNTTTFWCRDDNDKPERFG